MIERSILEANKIFSFFNEGQTVTVALSGGADSMALLYALNSLKSDLKINLKAAHLNHLIRDEEAFRDENFVKDQCKKLGIELFCEEFDVPKFAKSNSQSMELAARNIRYSFFQRINEGVVATAHTASDNIETVLLNLTRGTSIDGLCGIPPKRDIYIRPLIFATRDMIEDYCSKHKIPYITDSTNLSDDYTRNKIRHNIIPVLKELNPSVEKTVIRSSLSLKEISDDIKFSAETYIRENLNNDYLLIKDFNSLRKSVAKKVIINFVALFNNDISLESQHIENIYSICLNGGKTNIPKNFHCVVKNNQLRIISEEKKLVYKVDITEKKDFLYDKSENVNNLFLNNTLDCDKIVGKLVVRNRRPNDSIRLRNRGCTKPLTKLYNECDIPLSLRDNLPVIADERGVVWIHSIGVAERCAVKESTKNIYYINVKTEEYLNGTV